MYRATESAAWQEARYGNCGSRVLKALKSTMTSTKSTDEPGAERTECANVVCWPAPEQSGSRANLPVLAIQRGVFKCCRLSTGITELFISTCKSMAEISPIMGRRIFIGGRYPYNCKWEPGMAEEETRFFGLKRDVGYTKGKYCRIN